MVRERKAHANEQQAKAKRTKLPMPHEERLNESSNETQAPPELAFTLDHYLTDCFVDVALMIMEGGMCRKWNI